MAFRELYSNALDENGGVERVETAPEISNDTTIAVDLPAFEAIYFSIEEHFISKEEKPLWESYDLEIYQGRSLFIFYRGITIMKLKEPAAYRYNLKQQIDLTEDRTAKYSWQVKGRLESTLASITDDKIASTICDNRNSFEATLDYSAHTASSNFIAAAVKLGGNCNPTAMALVKAQMPKDKTIATVYGKAEPGGLCLSNALEVLRSLDADLSNCQFVLASGVKFYGAFDVRNTAIFLHEDIFEDQEKMTIAVLEGFAELSGHHWFAKQLMKQGEKTE
jgi:hypothetical protein